MFLHYTIAQPPAKCRRIAYSPATPNVNADYNSLSKFYFAPPSGIVVFNRRGWRSPDRAVTIPHAVGHGKVSGRTHNFEPELRSCRWWRRGRYPVGVRPFPGAATGFLPATEHFSTASSSHFAAAGTAALRQHRNSTSEFELGAPRKGCARGPAAAPALHGERRR